MQTTKITKLILENFRSFLQKKIAFDSSLILLVGENGAGKTNILEALTLIGKGPALRGSDFDEMLHLNYQTAAQSPQFSIFAQLDEHPSIENIGISFEKIAKKKNLQINGKVLIGKAASEFRNELINFIWLTPQLELLLISSKSERRDYLDKIVADIDPKHNERVNSYQKSLKERLLILQKYKNSQNKWVEIVENKIVELGVAIALARLEAIEFFNKAINSFESNFPKAQLKISGDIEEMTHEKSALQIEEFYHEKLLQNRALDLENFKTHFGVHRSNFSAIFTNKNAPSGYSSTGEQKSIMIGITLARAKISQAYKNQPTILIFDEIMSHLDNKKKTQLLEEIRLAQLQCFFSATSVDEAMRELVGGGLMQVEMV